LAGPQQACREPAGTLLLRVARPLERRLPGGRRGGIRAAAMAGKMPTMPASRMLAFR